LRDTVFREMPSGVCHFLVLHSVDEHPPRSMRPGVEPGEHALHQPPLGKVRLLGRYVQIHQLVSPRRPAFRRSFRQWLVATDR